MIRITVPLAKRGEPQGGGAKLNPLHSGHKMQQALEELQRAIQHALALGLGRAGGLEPLRDALRALQPHDALAPLADGVQAVLDTDDARVQLDVLTRLHYACGRLLTRLHADALPTLSADALHEPTRRVAAVVPPSSRLSPIREGSEAPSVPPAGRGNLQEGVLESFARLFRGEASLLETLPTVYAHLQAWQPDQPLLPIQLALAHYGTAHIALERLRALGATALQAVIQLAGSKSPAVRLRACELLLEYDAPKATAALRSALPKAPRALPLMQKLRTRPDLHEVLLKDGAPTLEQWLSALGDRRQYHQMLQQTEVQIMLLPPNAPALDALLQKVRTLAFNEYESWRMLARVPHERITQTLLAHPEWLRSQCYEHFLATLDYRLIPILRSIHPQFWREQVRQIAQNLPDAAFLTDALRGHPDLVKRFGEPAEVAQSRN